MKTFSKTSFVLAALLIALFAFSQPAAAQAEFPTPEITAWATDVAVRGGWLGMLILIDLVLGVTLAIKQKKFEWQRLADFLGDYAPKVIGWMCLEALTLLPPDLAIMTGLASALGTGAYAIIIISSAGSILTNVQAIGILPVTIPGVNRPQG
jgi:hypothetical protein